MIKESISVEEVIDFFNSLYEYDSKAIKNLIESRVSCNEKMANHPTIQVSDENNDANYKVGLLGIINGLFGIDSIGYGPIAVEDDLSKFIRVERRHLKSIGIRE